MINRPSQAIGNTAFAFARTWRQVDASNQVLGRMATRIAMLLMGKHKAIYDQSNDCGDYVVVNNCKHVTVTGKKSEQKLYRHHTGYPGGLKEIPYERMMDQNPDTIIRRAVAGMLPKNRLRKKRMARLFVFPEEEHPYKSNILTGEHAETLREAFKVPLKGAAQSPNEAAER